jgi:hypothetical protein
MYQYTRPLGWVNVVPGGITGSEPSSGDVLLHPIQKGTVWPPSAELNVTMPATGDGGKPMLDGRTSKREAVGEPFSLEASRYETL